MAIEKFATTPNQGITVLDGPLSDSATTIPVSSMADLKLTGLTGSDFAYVKLTKKANWRQHPINRKETFEIVKVTAVSGNDLTATRGVDGTSGTAFDTQDIVEVVFSSIHYQDIVDAITDGTAELSIGRLGVGTVNPGATLSVHGKLGVRDGAGDFAPENTFEIIENSASNVPMAQFRQLGTGDATIRFRNTALSYTMGIDNTDDNFKIAESAVVGISDRLIISSGTGDVEIVSGDIIGSGGDTYWVGAGTGLDFAEISIEESVVETVIGTAGVKVQVTVFNTNGPSNSAVPDHTSNHITITRAGHYFVIASTVINSIVGAGSLAHMTCQKNNGTAQIIPHKDREIAGGGGEAKPVTLSGIADLAVNDTIEIWIENETNTQNYIVEDCSLSLFMIGGT